MCVRERVKECERDRGNEKHLPKNMKITSSKGLNFGPVIDAARPFEIP